MYPAITRCYYDASLFCVNRTKGQWNWMSSGIRLPNLRGAIMEEEIDVAGPSLPRSSLETLRAGSDTMQCSASEDTRYECLSGTHECV